MKTLTRILLPVAVLCGFALAASATILVNDTWIDGIRTDPASPTYAENNGVAGSDADLDGNLESAWFLGGVGTLAPVGAGGPLRGDLGAGGASSATWTTYFTPEASPVTLANSGDKIKATWIFTPTSIGANNTSQNFRLALVDSPSASRISVDSSPGSAAYAGYAMFMNMGATLGNSNPFQLRERDGTSAALLSASTPPWNALANGATSGNHGYDSGTQYTYELTLTRNGSSLDIVSTMTGGTLNATGTATVSLTDATPNSFTYDTFSIRPSGATTTAQIFDTSLFQVEFIPAEVPEPSVLGLAALGFLGLALRRRMAR